MIVRAIEIPEGTHCVLLERAEKGRKRLLQEVLSFLGSRSSSVQQSHTHQKSIIRTEDSR